MAGTTRSRADDGIPTVTSQWVIFCTTPTPFLPPPNTQCHFQRATDCLDFLPGNWTGPRRSSSVAKAFGTFRKMYGFHQMCNTIVSLLMRTFYGIRPHAILIHAEARVSRRFVQRDNGIFLLPQLFAFTCQIVSVALLVCLHSICKCYTAAAKCSWLSVCRAFHYHQTCSPVFNPLNVAGWSYEVFYKPLCFN